MKYRVDELLVSKGLCESRAKAQALIMAGKVRSGDHRLDKPGKKIPEDTPLTVEQPPPFVSRAGEKLDAFLKEYPIAVENCDILDIGASTGGFTDCLLQRGANSATCVDVGRAQLHHKLLTHPKVTNLEKLNARHLTAESLPLADYPLIVMDLSFISLTKVLPNIWQFLRPGGHLIALIKPQFEASKEEVSKGQGIIKDPEIHARIQQEILDFAQQELLGSELVGQIDSPIKGTDGNQEFLIGLRKQG
tara:strand:- start:45745 stop:46488 length:744 start_codon:yes stop_codon:yes gene_type:complete